MRDRQATFRALEALPAEVRLMVNWSSRPWDAVQLLQLYLEAERDIGREKAIDWIQRSIQAADGQDVNPMHAAAGVSILGYVPPRQPRNWRERVKADRLIRTVRDA